MKISFDSSKDRANNLKHGVSLALAEELEWETALIWSDDRKEYGESRLSALVLFEERLFFVAFVEREDEIRVISFRKANAREVRKYVSENYYQDGSYDHSSWP